jgi:hypothetical protein
MRLGRDHRLGVVSPHLTPNIHTHISLFIRIPNFPKAIICLEEKMVWWVAVLLPLVSPTCCHSRCCMVVVYLWLILISFFGDPKLQYYSVVTGIFDWPFTKKIKSSFGQSQNRYFVISSDSNIKAIMSSLNKYYVGCFQVWSFVWTSVLSFFLLLFLCRCSRHGLTKVDPTIPVPINSKFKHL